MGLLFRQSNIITSFGKTRYVNQHNNVPSPVNSGCSLDFNILLLATKKHLNNKMIAVPKDADFLVCDLVGFKSWCHA